MIEALSAVGVGERVSAAVESLAAQLRYRESRTCLCGHAHVLGFCSSCGCVEFRATRERWVEVPAFRALIVTNEQLVNDYYPVDERGMMISNNSGREVHRWIRRSDNKPFAVAPFQPANAECYRELALVAVT